MRMGKILENDSRWIGVVSTAAVVATSYAKTWALSVSNRTANRSRDNAWTIGDQAMNKTASVTASANARGCF